VCVAKSNVHHTSKIYFEQFFYLNLVHSHKHLRKCSAIKKGYVTLPIDFYIGEERERMAGESQMTTSTRAAFACTGPFQPGNLN